MKPMLAAPTDGLNLNYPIMVSPKLDGVRALILEGVVMSRSLKPIPNEHVQKLFGSSDLNGLDGELIVGKAYGDEVYRRTTSGVMSRDGLPDVSFMVFDDFMNPGSFSARFKQAQNRVRRYGKSSVKIVEHHIVACQETLFSIEEGYVSEGFEGVMIRHPDGPYKEGRSTPKEGYLFKLKRFEDGEAEIIGFEELLTNHNAAVVNKLGQLERGNKREFKSGADTLGALKVVDLKTGVEFSIGSGFSASDRTWFWVYRKMLTGRIVKYKFQPVGVKDKPRFPVYQGFRDPIDF